jgi:hypothetical protein
VVGSYPPAPGPAAAATVAAVRRAWADGQQVVVASPRPSAALLVVPVAGAEVGPALSRLRRPSGVAGSGPGCDHVVVCVEPGWPLGRGRRPPPGRPMTREELEQAARSLAAALSGFNRAELVVTGDPGVPGDVLAVLWPSVERVTASSEGVAASLRASGAPSVSVVEPYSGAGLSYPRDRDDGEAWVGTVSPLEPTDWLLLARGRRLIGSAARKVLGPRAPAVRAYLFRAGVEARKRFSQWQQRRRSRGRR